MKGKRSKYNAQKTTVDNIVFHSKREANRYGELKLLEKAGEIHNLELQPRFELETSRWGGGIDFVKIGTYVADFAYMDREYEVIVEDVKGFKTPLYRWKKKHVAAQYGIEIREV